jgi:ABC-2 type transport system ATP-binding protein
MTDVLRAENLTKTIKGTTIVDSISFSVGSGEVFGFLGPNGAGKTTTIRMLVGLIRPTAGRVLIAGRDLHEDFEAALSTIGCIVETPDLYRFLTGRQNLEHFARMLAGVGPERIEEVARLVHLDHRLDDRVGTYSLGMRQRLGIAQALLGRPRLLILDEPANGLDPAGIREIRQLFRDLAATGLSIFISSHLLAEIELMCDRVAIIHKGRVVTTGSVKELISSRREIELRVDDAQRASEVLCAISIPFERRNGSLVLGTEPEKIPMIVTRMVEAGVDIHEVTSRAQTLEEMFLEATGGETVAR